MDNRGWLGGWIACVVVLSAGCSASHLLDVDGQAQDAPSGAEPDADAPSARGSAASTPAAETRGDGAAASQGETSVGAGTSEADPGAARCGYASGHTPALVGVRDSAVFTDTVDGAPRLLHAFDESAESAASLAAILTRTPAARPSVRVAGDLVLVEVGGAHLGWDSQSGTPLFSGTGRDAQLRALRTRAGALKWSRSWAPGEGHDVRAFSARGDVVEDGLEGHRWVEPDGRVHDLVEGFTPFEAPDADGWLGGVFSAGGEVTHYGFADGRSGEARPLARDRPQGQSAPSHPLLRDGRFYYAVRDADGRAHVAIEGPQTRTLLPLRTGAGPLMLSAGSLPELTHGERYTLVELERRPLAVLDRLHGTLEPLAGPGDGAQAAQRGELSLVRASGDFFLAVSETASMPAREYRVHGPSATLDTAALPPLPPGYDFFAYAGCYGTAGAVSWQGRMLLPLTQAALGDESPVELHLEREDGSGYAALGQPVVYGLDPAAVRVGDTWLVTTRDVRNTYCPQPPQGDPADPGPGVLVGDSVQVLAPAMQLTYDTREGGPTTEVELSADGSCALVVHRDGAELIELSSGARRSVDLERPRWL